MDDEKIARVDVAGLGTGGCSRKRRPGRSTLIYPPCHGDGEVQRQHLPDQERQERRLHHHTDRWLHAELPGQTTGLRLSYDGGYNFYANNNENDGWQHNALGSFWHNFTRETRLDFNNAFLYTQDPLGNRDVVNQQGNVVAPGDYTRRAGLNTYYRNYSTARLTHQFGPENSTYAQFIYGFLKNNSDQYQDSQEISPSVGMTYWLSTWTGIELEGAYLRGLYSGGQGATNTQDGTDQDDFNEVSGRVRLNHRLSPRYGFFEQYRQIYRNYDGNQADQAATARRPAKPGLYGVCALRRPILPI